MESLHSHRTITQSINAGFTLIEMLVVLAIITTITGIVLNGQSGFNKTIILANTAYDIALSLRAAETYGTGGKAIGTSPVGYGLHFAKVASPGVINSYLLFADDKPDASAGSACHSPANTQGGLDAQPGDCVYTSSDTPARTMNYTLGNGIFISDFCAFTNSWSCANSGSGTPLTSLDIVFARPNPDALMSTNVTYSSAIQRVCIKIASPQGDTARYISVESTGAINANSSLCPL